MIRAHDTEQASLDGHSLYFISIITHFDNSPCDIRYRQDMVYLSYFLYL